MRRRTVRRRTGAPDHRGLSGPRRRSCSPAAAAPAAARAQAAPRPATTDTARTRRAAPSSDYWSFYLLPFPSYNALEGLGASLSGGWRKASPPGPVPIGISIEPTAVITTSGTMGAQLVFDEEGRWRGWRLLLMAGTLREQRAPYFGLGNRSGVDDSLDSRYGVAYATYSLLRTTGLVAVRRQLAGPLHLLVGAQFRHYRARPLAGRHSKLADDLTAGVPLDTGATDGLEVRGDSSTTRATRRRPPRRGSSSRRSPRADRGGSRKLAYTRYALGMREFVPIGEFTTLAFRQSVEISRGGLPFYVSDERMTSWRPEDGFGGVTTLRAHLPGRFSAPNKALLSADLRYRNWDFWVTPTTPVRLWFLVFADVGRVWMDGETFAGDHLHAGGGVGTRLQVGRAGFFGFDLGWSPDAHFNFATALSLAY